MKSDCSLYLIFGHCEVQHKQPWHKMKVMRYILKQGIKLEVLQPIPSLEGAGTGVLYTYLALLDGDHVGETAQHPGPI